MSFLDLFIERTEDDKSSNSTKPATNSAVPKLSLNSVSPSIQTFPTSPAPQSQDMSKFNEHFDSLFSQANLPGPDYFEFSKMCQAMAALPEDAKFPAVFMGLQVQGLTKEKLIESANHYIAIIDEDTKKFNDAIDGKIIADVQAKRLTVENKKKALQEKITMIAQLQAELEKDNMEIENLTAEANDQEKKATEKASIYKMACEARKTSIFTDVQKISTYIK
jgi:hypothetical protein